MPIWDKILLWVLRKPRSDVLEEERKTREIEEKMIRNRPHDYPGDSIETPEMIRNLKNERPILLDMVENSRLRNLSSRETRDELMRYLMSKYTNIKYPGSTGPNMHIIASQLVDESIKEVERAVRLKIGNELKALHTMSNKPVPEVWEVPIKDVNALAELVVEENPTDDWDTLLKKFKIRYKEFFGEKLLPETGAQSLLWRALRRHAEREPKSEGPADRMQRIYGENVRAAGKAAWGKTAAGARWAKPYAKKAARSIGPGWLSWLFRGSLAKLIISGLLLFLMLSILMARIGTGASNIIMLVLLTAAYGGLFYLGLVAKREDKE